MRFFKLKKKPNWKYILGEILLLFIGINLAIWFNNWNTSKKLNEDKKIAIHKITEEIKSNKNEIDNILNNYQSILNAYGKFKGVYDKNTSIVITTPSYLDSLNKKHPDFFKVKDSIAVNDSLFRYWGSTFIDLEIPNLSEIAWKTTMTLNISNIFDYECLYEIENLYNLQRRVQKEIDKAANALQKRELETLMNILEFLNQLGVILREKYDSVLESSVNCKE